MIVWTVFLATSFITTYLLLKLWIQYAHKRGILAPDAHKINNPLVANRGGVVFVAPLLLYFIVPLLYRYHGKVSVFNEALAIFLATMITYTIGLLDDMKNLGLKKVPLTATAGLIFILLGAYWPKPVIPFIGPIRLSIIYPLLILIAFLIVPNGSNMIDVHNGTLAVSILAVLAPLLLWSNLLGDDIASCYIAIAFGIVLGFFVLNKYPAKVFAGNVGSYALGGLLASIIIVSRMEYIAVIAWLPAIMTGFYIISSVGGIMTREKIAAKVGKPVEVRDGILYPAMSENAPISLSRLLLLEVGPMSESELVKEYYKLFIYSAILGALTGLFMFKL